jgi:hypothetical protein
LLSRLVRGLYLIYELDLNGSSVLIRWKFRMGKKFLSLLRLGLYEVGDADSVGLLLGRTEENQGGPK